ARNVRAGAELDFGLADILLVAEGQPAAVDLRAETGIAVARQHLTGNLVRLREALFQILAREAERGGNLRELLGTGVDEDPLVLRLASIGEHLAAHPHTIHIEAE